MSILPFTASRLCAAEERAGRRTPAMHDALARAAVCEAQAAACQGDARANLARAERAADAGNRRDAVRFACCALTCDRSAAAWHARGAEHLAGYLARHDRAPAPGARRAA